MQDPDVDHIIAVHDPSRPVARAVASVLDHTTSQVRVSVVCHNTDAAAVQVLLAERSTDPRLRFLELHDGIRSPSGPFNVGLDAATARFTSIMGSDDELEPGAIDSWLARANAAGADVLLPRVRHVGGRFLATPPVRLLRGSRLDGVRDRLAYRSAPLGLVSRQRFGNVRFPGGLASGEDVQYATALWYSGARLEYDRRGPAYLVHSDASDRTSMTARPIRDDAAFVEPLLASDEFRMLTPRQRSALVVKLLRSNVVSWVVNRRSPEDWGPHDHVELADCVRLCLANAADAVRPLSRADRDLLDAILDETTPVERIIHLARERGRFVRPAGLLPRRLSDVLRREAPLRFGAASVLAARGR